MTAIRISVAGASGRMGRTLIRALAEAEDMRLAFALERTGHTELGTDAGVLAGLAKAGIALSDDSLAAPARADGVLGFSPPARRRKVCGAARRGRGVPGIGST